MISFCSFRRRELVSNSETSGLPQEGEQLVKKVGGVFAFNVKDGPGGETARWVVDVKSGKGSVTIDPGAWLMLLLDKHRFSTLAFAVRKRRKPSLSYLKRSSLTASPGWI